MIGSLVARVWEPSEICRQWDLKLALGRQAMKVAIAEEPVVELCLVGVGEAELVVFVNSLLCLDSFQGWDFAHLLRIVEGSMTVCHLGRHKLIQG